MSYGASLRDSVRILGISLIGVSGPPAPSGSRATRREGRAFREPLALAADNRAIRASLERNAAGRRLSGSEEN